MKHYVTLMAALFAVLFAACSADDELSNVSQQPSRNLIGFNAVGNTVKSRGNVINSENIYNEHLMVWAVPTGESTLLYMNRVKLNYNASYKEWVYTDEVLYYWPSYKLDFFVMCPYDERVTWVENNNRWRAYVWAEVGDEYGGGAKNEDLMFAKTFDQTNLVNGTEDRTKHVPLEFKHMFAQVAFKAKTDNSELSVTVYSMKLHNFVSRGKFYLTDGIWHGTDGTNNDINDFTVGLNDSTITFSEKVTDVSTEKPLFVIPWGTSLWVPNPNHGIAGADAANQCYLEIECKVMKGDEVILDATGENSHLYYPFGDYWNTNGTTYNWKPGVKYTYTLNLKGGYDKDGNAIIFDNSSDTGHPILFDVDTSNMGWNGSDENVY